jgi:hypothetical protein
MTEEQGYVIREWGNGYWKWSCTGQGRSGRHSGIVGPPFRLEDVQRMAEEHWAQAHAEVGLILRPEARGAAYSDG